MPKANDRPGCKDEEEDGPLEEGVVDDVVDDGPKEVPLCLQPGAFAAGTTPEITDQQFIFFLKST